MIRRFLGVTLTCLLMIGQPAAEQGINQVVQQVEKAIHMTPDIDNGREVYRLCAVCHLPEGWGTKDGSYPQIAGQHSKVIIKQLADILARNRDTPLPCFPSLFWRTCSCRSLPTWRPIWRAS